MATETVERDLEYSFGAPNGDPWFAASLLASVALSAAMPARL